MNSLVRPAIHDDAAAACRAVRRSIALCCIDDHRNDPCALQAWLANKTPQRFAQWIADAQSFSVVAQLDAQIVGFALLRNASVLLCYVVSEARGTGSGFRMLSSLENHAITAGTDCLNLQSTRSAEHFYRRQGFVPAGPPILSCGIAAVPMTKALRATW